MESFCDGKQALKTLDRSALAALFNALSNLILSQPALARPLVPCRLGKQLVMRHLHNRRPLPLQREFLQLTA